MLRAYDRAPFWQGFGIQGPGKMKKKYNFLCVCMRGCVHVFVCVVCSVHYCCHDFMIFVTRSNKRFDFWVAELR